MRNPLCWLGLHWWRYDEEWEPSFWADIVTRWQMIARCRWCKKEEKIADERFDPDTGDWINTNIWT
jgi:hypothetical protein